MGAEDSRDPVRGKADRRRRAPKDAAARPLPADVCPFCGAVGEPISCKLVCPRCRIVIANCSEF